VPPGRAGSHPPPNPVNQLPLAPLGRTTCPFRLGQHRPENRLQHRPLRVSQVEPPRRRYAGHEVSVLMVVLVDEPSTGDLTRSGSPTRRPPPDHPSHL